jgi:hypothetical protein
MQRELKGVRREAICALALGTTRTVLPVFLFMRVRTHFPMRVLRLLPL